MGVTAIDEVMGGAKSDDMRQKLCEFKTEHETLKGRNGDRACENGRGYKGTERYGKGHVLD